MQAVDAAAVSSFAAAMFAAMFLPGRGRVCLPGLSSLSSVDSDFALRWCRRIAAAVASLPPNRGQSCLLGLSSLAGNDVAEWRERAAAAVALPLDGGQGRPSRLSP